MATDPIEAVIRDLELRLMTPAIRNYPELAGLLLADDFLEFGSSGQTYDKAAVLAAIANDATPAPDIETSRFVPLAATWCWPHTKPVAARCKASIPNDLCARRYGGKRAIGGNLYSTKGRRLSHEVQSAYVRPNMAFNRTPGHAARLLRAPVAPGAG